jgi:hypothetical protein
MNDYIPPMHIVVGITPLAMKLCSFLLPYPSTLFWTTLSTCIGFLLGCPLEFSKSPWLKKKKKLGIIKYKN